jgi:hypothetical protein
MKYSFHPEATEEFLEAISYFEECREALGLEFSKEVFATIQRIIHIFPWLGLNFQKIQEGA